MEVLKTAHCKLQIDRMNFVCASAILCLAELVQVGSLRTTYRKPIHLPSRNPAFLQTHYTLCYVTSCFIFVGHVFSIWVMQLPKPPVSRTAAHCSAETAIHLAGNLSG